MLCMSSFTRSVSKKVALSRADIFPEQRHAPNGHRAIESEHGDPHAKTAPAWRSRGRGKEREQADRLKGGCGLEIVHVHE